MVISTVKLMKVSFQERTQELGVGCSRKAQVTKLYMFKAIVLKAF